MSGNFQCACCILKAGCIQTHIFHVQLFIFYLISYTALWCVLLFFKSWAATAAKYRERGKKVAIIQSLVVQKADALYGFYMWASSAFQSILGLLRVLPSVILHSDKQSPDYLLSFSLSAPQTAQSCATRSASRSCWGHWAPRLDSLLQEARCFSKKGGKNSKFSQCYESASLYGVRFMEVLMF